MKRSITLLMSFVVLFLAGCSPSILRFSPTQTNTPTKTSIATFTLTSTATPNWTPTLSPTPTFSPTPTVIPTPIPGTMFYDWLKVNGVAVYAGNVVLCWYDYSCRGETLENFKNGKWDPTNTNSQFVYVGQAGAETKQINDITFLFPENATYTDVVIIFQSLAVDYIAGILPDGREVPFNYTFDSNGVLVPGSNFFDGTTIGGSVANQSHTLDKIIACGIAGIIPDNSYSLANGGILFRLPKVSYEKLTANPRLWGTRGENVYELIGIRIVYNDGRFIPKNSYCPYL